MTDTQDDSNRMVRVHMLNPARPDAVVTVDGDSWRRGHDTGSLLIERGDELVVEFAPGTWSHVECATVRAEGVFGSCVTARDATDPSAVHAVHNYAA